jgi:hypothetical protein
MAALPELLSTIRESPAYAGIAFYGRLKAVDLPLIKRLVANNATAESAITQIRAAKALQVSASAKKGGISCSAAMWKRSGAQST